MISYWDPADNAIWWRESSLTDTSDSEIFDLILKHDHGESTGRKVTKDTFLETMDEQDSYRERFHCG